MCCLYSGYLLCLIIGYPLGLGLGFVVCLIHVVLCFVGIPSRTPDKDMDIYISAQYPECGIFWIKIYLYISIFYVSGAGSICMSWLPVLSSGPLFRFSLIPNIQYRTPGPPIPIPCHRATSRITHKALQSNFLPHPYTPPVKFFYIRRTSQVFPISRSSQLSQPMFHGEPNHDFHTQFSLQTENPNRNTLIFNKNEHA